MKKNLTKAQLTQLVAERAVAFYQVQAQMRLLRERLNDEYSAFFQATGEPEPQRRRIDPDNPAYGPVIAYTADSYELYRRARLAKNSAKRRMETAIRALLGPDACVYYLPPASSLPALPVRRTNATGETLQ
ncbi:hypothetical protein EXN22_17955 [Pseudomonas tructae]|uniref:Uncharacterized protein n=1 Tax=Pseudomonas tructae TaxID=2518644 RepID=A0A411ML03_9PSED|nr:hypothetical protein [Pseudomonas tructae]QBF27475.1 hypothetical protein EXN22_17955 [Pseudomonas tructae]